MSRLEVALEEVELLLLVVVGELGLAESSSALAGSGTVDRSGCWCDGAGGASCASCASVGVASELSVVASGGSCDSASGGLSNLVGTLSGGSNCSC